jgi:hypothetical protein
MRALTCLVATLSIIPATRTSAQPPQPRDRPPDAVGTAAIRGRVVDATTGDPVRKVQVRANSPLLRDGRTVRTDAAGRYELKALPAGRYMVSAQKPAYVTAMYGQATPMDPGIPLDVADGQIIERVDIAIARGGVITGRVTDEFGEPAAEVQVGVMRIQIVNGERRTMSTNTRMTNDAGEFRIFGIAPGQHYLAATYRNYGMSDVPNQPAYAPMYFPGTGRADDAQRLTIAPGTILNGLNLTLTPTRAMRVSGVAFDSSGRRMTSGSVTLVHFESAPGGSPSGSIGPDGTFSIANVPPGDYVLRATQTFGAAAEAALLPITVDNVNVDDVRLMAAKLTAVTGHIVLDPKATGRPALSNTQVITAPLDALSLAARLGTPAVFPVKEDFTFELKAFPGRMTLNAAPLPSGWAQKAVRLNGVDVSDTGIDMAADATRAVEIEVTNLVGELSGQVIDANGQPTRSAWVILFTQDRGRWRPPARFSFASRPGPNNQYKTVVVRPGKFLVIALDNVEQGEWTDPDFLERIRDRAVPIEIGEGEKKTFDLTLSPRT